MVLQGPPFCDILTSKKYIHTIRFAIAGSQDSQLYNLMTRVFVQRFLFFALLMTSAIYSRSQCNSTFKLSLNGNGTEFAYDIVEIAGGDMIIAGQTTSFGAGGNDIFLTRMTKDGNIVWSKTYGGANDEQIRKIKLAADGNILITGQTMSYGNPSGNVLAMKIDLNGIVLWSIQLGENIGYSLGLDIISTTDNGFVIVGTDYAPVGTGDWLITKVDASGNILWTKRLTNNFSEDAFSVIQKNDTLLVSGDCLTSSDYSNVIVKMALVDGTVYNSRSYIIDGRGAFSSKIEYSSNQYRLSVHIIDGASYAQMQEGFIMMDPMLNPLKTFKINASPYTNNYFTGFFQTSDGGFITTGSPSGSNQGYLYKFDQAGNLVFTNEFSSTGSLLVYSAIQASDLSIWVVGSENGHAIVIKLNTQGQFENCANQPVQSDILQPSLSNAVFNWAAITTFNFQSPAITPTSTGFSFIIDSLCFAPTCSIQLLGKDSVCGATDTITYTAIRNGDCGGNILWSLPQGVYSKVSTDTTIQVQFPVSGSYTVLAASSNICAPQKDSVQVFVKLSPTSVFLGNDSTLCYNASVLLNAGSGFQSYLWQDGNSSETYSATRSGVYYVTATNYCAQTLSDTVNLNFRRLSPFLVAPADTSFCIPAPVPFTATGGDIYNWSPATYLSNAQISNPTALPDSSIVYQLKITDTVCNISQDLQVKITIDPLPIVSLSKSNDIDCTIATAHLTAAGGNTYQWSPATSLNNPNIPNPIANPTETTTYTVEAFNSLGCNTIDSLTIYFTKTGVSNIYLPNAFTPNGDGHNDIFMVEALGAAKIKHFSIFNRWGQMVFSTDDIAKGWDGTFNGVAQPAGTYVWQVQTSDPCVASPFKKGQVTLIR